MGIGYLDLEKYKVMLGVYVREQREFFGLTPSALAKKAQLRVSQIGQIEAGQILPKEATLEKLKFHLELSESRLEKIEEVAKVAFINNLLKMMNTGKSERSNDHS